jgi:hypothetical protein
MNRKFTDGKKISQILPVQNIQTSDVTSDYVSIADARVIVANFYAEAPGSEKKLTAQLLQATTAGGDGEKPLTTVLEIVEGTFGTLEVKDSDLDQNNGFKFVALKLGTDADAAKLGGGTLILDSLRYS